jgi:hypothetical protein
MIKSNKSWHLSLAPPWSGLLPAPQQGVSLGVHGRGGVVMYPTIFRSPPPAPGKDGGPLRNVATAPAEP